jgi:hypothetical protein
MSMTPASFRARIGVAIASATLGACHCGTASPSSYSVTLTANPSSLPADGVSVSTVTAVVLNSDSVPAAGVTLTFTSSRGSVDQISQPTSPTDATGSASGTVSSKTPGTSDISVSIDGAVPTGSTQIVFVALDAGTSTDAGPREDAGHTDAGKPDSGVEDSGAPDAGSVDSGSPDAGSVPDAGKAPDSGQPSDAGTVLLSKLAFTTAPQALTAGTCSAATTVQLQDSAGNPVNATSLTQVSLTSTSNGNTFYSDACVTVVTSVSIAQGANSATFYFRDTVAGGPTLTASSATLMPATQVETITAGPADILTYVSGNQQTGTVGAAMSAPFVVEVTDAFGNPVAGTTVTFAATGGGGSVVPANGVSGVNGRVSSAATLGTRAGADTFSAGSMGLMGSPVVFTATAAAGAAFQLAFASSPQTVVASTCSGAATVQVQDSFGNPVTVTAATTIDLSSTSKTMLFSTNSCATAASTATVGAGQSTATFYFSDPTAGMPTITAASTGLKSATQVETISAGTPVISPTLSTVTVTSACLTATTSAESGVVVAVKDTSGNAVSGATVTIASSNASVGFVESSTQTSSVAGTYYRTLAAPASLPVTLSTTISVTADNGGTAVMLSTTPTVAIGTPNATTGGGLGGCAPPDGHVRIRVVEAESPTTPIVGADVIVGASQGTPYTTSVAALISGSPPSGTNVGTTNVAGYLEFQDFGTVLNGPVTVTAVDAAGVRDYFTFYLAGADDLVVPLGLISPPATQSWDYTAGTGSNPNVPACTGTSAANFYGGLVSYQTDLDNIASFNLDSLLGPDVCQNLGVTSQIVPGNIWAPAQTVKDFGLCIATTNEVFWTLDQIPAGSTNFVMMFGDIPVATLTANPSSTQIIEAFTPTQIGFELNHDVTGNAAGFNVALNDAFQNNFTIDFSNVPAQADLIGLNVGDYSGGDGAGSLFVLGFGIQPYNTTGTSVSVVNSTLLGTNSPSKASRIPGMVATYLAPIGTRTVPANKQAASTTILMRRSADVVPPQGGVTRNTSNYGFLDTSGATVNGTNTTFSFTDAGDLGTAPHYSRSNLQITRTTYLPSITCNGTTATNTQQSSRVDWQVVKPYALNCTGTECFTLPTLPATFPRASSGTLKLSGFEQRVGSGTACTSTAGCDAAIGESCQTPPGLNASICVGTDGNGNYFTEKEAWGLGIERDGLNASFSIATLDLGTRTQDMTQLSSNTATFSGQ